MKKIKFITAILLIVLLSSCSAEEDKSTCTSCIEVLEYSTDADPIWRSGNQQFPTHFNCISNGYTYIINGYYSSAMNTYVYRRRRVECK